MPLPMFEKKKDPPPPFSHVKNIIGIAAGKGGVGKSTLTVNLARALQRMGYAVGVMDTDLYGPSIRRMLPEDHMPNQQGEKIVPANSKGIKLISMAYFRPEEEATAVRAPIANKILGQFINGVEWGELDFLLIDFPPGTGDIQLTLGQQARLNGAVMVTTPQEVALMDVRKAIHLFDQVQVPVIGIVENMSYYRDEKTGEAHYLFGQGGGRRLAQEYGVPFLGEIPIDSKISFCGDEGKSLFENETLSTGAHAFLAVAHALLEEMKGLGKRRAKIEIAKMFQKDQATFVIEWNDGRVDSYSLARVQKECPCAGCFEAKEKGEHTVDEKVSAEKVTTVGRYALKIHFTSGCSAGIYDFSLLRRIAGE